MRTAAAAAAAAIALIACLANPVAAADVPIPPSPSRWVTDNASFISSDARDRIDARLQAYEKRTGHQVIVWIGATTGDTPLDEWTIDAFTKWKVGRKQLDDGAALFIFSDDRKVRIEVGYGLEPVLTDARSSEIIRNDIVPKIRAGDHDGAVQSAVDDMLATIDAGQSGMPTPSPEGSAPGGQFDPATLIGIFIAIMFLILIFRSPGLAGWMLYTIGSGRGGGFGGGGFGGFGGGFGGGGGFSGGGGMGGGGGASGGW